MANKRNITIEERKKRLFYTEPADKEELWWWAKLFFGVELTKEAVCPHHDSQLDYFWWTTQQMGDVWVLACRGGGKTQIAGAATVYDSEFHAPCHTISVAGCLHPQTPVLTSMGYKPISCLKIGEEVFNGQQWRKVKGITARPPIESLKVSFIGFPPMYLTHQHRIMRIKGIECRIENRISPRVCSAGVNCAYHRRRFHCRGRGEIEEVPASELNVGDAFIYPLTYMNYENGYKCNLSPFIQGLLFGSHTERKNGLLVFSKRYSISREYDRDILDRIREGIGKHLAAKPVVQKSTGKTFVLGYDAQFFKNYSTEADLPYRFFFWPKDDKREFLRGALTGSRYVLFNLPSYNRAFTTTRNTKFALNLFALVAHSRPRLDYWAKDSCTRLVFADTSIPNLKKEVLARFSSLESIKRRAGAQAELKLKEWGQSLGTRVKSIEECPPGLPFFDIEVEDSERFLTLWGVVHNSKLQASHMQKYTLPIYRPGPRGIASDNAVLVGRELTELKNGSKIQIIASSEEAAGGFHVDRIRMDQIDDMKPNVYETLQFDIDQSSDEHTQVDMVGTWDKLGGLYDKVLQQARNQNQKIFSWCLADVIEPCKDRLCANCDLSDCCGGVAKDKTEGFMKIDKAIQTRRRLITQTKWDVQMLLKTPRPLDAVIPKFTDAAPFVQHVGYNPTLETFRGFDWGTRANYACVWIQFNEHEDRLFVIDEYVGKARIGAIEAAKGTTNFEARKGYRNISGSFGDPSGASWIRDFNLMGIKTLSLFVPKETRLDILTKLLEIRKDGRPGIIISPNCRHLRKQLLSYDIRNLHKIRGASPDDVVDALLYPLGGLRYKLKLRDDSPPGVLSIRKSQERARIAKFSPLVERYLEIARGKTDYTTFFP